MSETFTYTQLNSATSIDHYSFQFIPPELRTAAYDLSVLNDGANRSRPYSAADHERTERWKASRFVWSQMQRGRTVARIVMSEAALRNTGGDTDAARHIQQEAVQHVAECALTALASPQQNVKIRVTPFSANTRGAPTFIVAGFEGGVSRLATYDLVGGKMYDDAQKLSDATDRFEGVWEASLSEGDTIDYLADFMPA